MAKYDPACKLEICQTIESGTATVAELSRETGVPENTLYKWIKRYKQNREGAFVTNILTGEKNRAQNCLTVSNLKLDDVFSDVFGKSAMSITKYILDHPGEKFDITPFVDGRCKKPIEEIQAAVDGSISHEQATKLREILKHIDEIKAHKQNIEAEILRLAAPIKRLWILFIPFRAFPPTQ